MVIDDVVVHCVVVHMDRYIIMCSATCGYVYHYAAYTPLFFPSPLLSSAFADQLLTMQEQSTDLAEGLQTLLTYQRHGQRILQGMLGRAVGLDDVAFYATSVLSAVALGVCRVNGVCVGWVRGALVRGTGGSVQNMHMCIAYTHHRTPTYSTQPNTHTTDIHPPCTSTSPHPGSHCHHLLH